MPGDEHEQLGGGGAEKKEEHDQTQRSSQPAPSSLHEEGSSTTTRNRNPPDFLPVDFQSPQPPQRSNTTPTRPPTRGPVDHAPGTRPRRVTVSARPADLSPMSLARSRSPRSNITIEDRGRMHDILEEEGRGRVGSSVPRRSLNSQRGVRQRSSTITGRPRAATIFRRPSRLAYAVGANPDAQSMNFSLAGPQDSLPVNQPYVEPGYADLNPAYDQPVNARPVWGLAKPLPRVIRPGMVPSVSELRTTLNQANEEAVQPEETSLQDVDLEKGQVEPTLKLSKITSQLQAARELRENRLLQRRASVTSDSIPGPGDLRPLTPHDEAPEEEEESEAGEDHPVSPPAVQRPSVLDDPSFSFGPGGSVLDHTKQESQVHPQLDDDASTQFSEAKDDDWLTDAIKVTDDHGAGDEVHNHHTHWSVIRTRFREPLAEFLAVLVQLTLGFCSDLAVVTSNGRAGNEATTDWAWGLSTMVGIYIAGGISGAHLNPAISIMLYIYRGFPLHKVPSYVFAQILGAFVAGLISYGLYRSDIIEYGGAHLAAGGTMNAFITNPRYSWIDASTAFFTEFTGTAFLAIAVLALGDDTNAPPGAGMNAFILGLIITVLSMAFGYNTGAAMNPSRDLGPRLALLAVGYGGELFRNGWWVYGPWAATISGACFGAFAYDVAIFVGGESPINYPRHRIKRAGHKWKKRTAARVGRAKRKLGLKYNENE